MLELEKKILLTKEEYLAIIMKMGRFAQPVMQTNYYFDTQDLTLNRKGITCRIRFKNQKYTAEIKSHSKVSRYGSIEKLLFTSNNFEEGFFNKMGLYLQGSLVTQRRILYKDEFCEIMLDKNTYLGVIDFELEIEYKQHYAKYAQYKLYHIARFLLRNGLIKSIPEFLERIDRSENKSKRFFNKKYKK